MLHDLGPDAGQPDAAQAQDRVLLVLFGKELAGELAPAEVVGAHVTGCGAIASSSPENSS